MKKFIAIAVLAFASSAVFAGGVSPAVHSNDAAPVVDASTSAADAPVSAPAPSALEKGATKVGSVLGGMLRSTVKLGQAVGKGVREGLANDGAKSTDVSSTSQAPAKSAIFAPTAALGAALTTSASLPTAAFASVFSNPVTSRLATLVKRDKDQPVAPIEERSRVASNPN